MYEPLIKWALKHGPDIVAATDSDSDEDICHSAEVFNLVCRVSYVDRRGWSESSIEQFQLKKYSTQVYDFLTKNDQKISLKKVIISLQKNQSICSDLVAQITEWLYHRQCLDLFHAVELIDKLSSGV